MREEPDRTARELMVETWPGDESIPLGYEEVFTYFEGLRDLERKATVQARSADGSLLVAEVKGEIESVEWDPHAPTLPGTREFDVCGDGWVFGVPERQFVEAEIWLVGHARDGGLVTLLGGAIEAGVAYDGPPDEPLSPDHDVWPDD